MSVDYYLEMNTPLSVEEIIPKLFRNFNYTRQPLADGAVEVSTDFFIAEVSKFTEEDYAISSPFGIKSTIRVYFYNLLFSSDDREIGYEALVRMTVDWLNLAQDDTALLFMDETVVLFRKSGELIRNGNAYWTPQALALVTLPHKVEYIPIH